MKTNRLICIAFCCLATFSHTTSAAVLNILNGTGYEWLELTATQGMSRDQVEVAIANATPGDSLYGYQYASRSLTEELLLSYAAWDGLDGPHDTASVVAGSQNFLSDFGVLSNASLGGGTLNINTVEGNVIAVASLLESDFLYGTDTECVGTSASCLGYAISYLDLTDTAIGGFQSSKNGWSASAISPDTFLQSGSNPNIGSLLVRTSAVPVPPALWLFGSGLLGLIGTARARRTIKS